MVRFASRNLSTTKWYLSFPLLSADVGPRQEAPSGFSSVKLDQAAGSSSSLRVWPVGAVSKIITSNFSPSDSLETKRENSSKEAISVVQAPERSSLILFISSLVAIPSRGWVTLFRYSSSACSGLILIAKRLLIPLIELMFSSTGLSNTSFKLDAGRAGQFYLNLPIQQPLHRLGMFFPPPLFL